MVASPPSSRIMLANVSPSASSRICWVHHQYSSSVSPFQAKTGTPCGVLGGAVRADRDRGGGVVLGGEDVAGGPADLGAERDQGLDEHRGLDGHVQRAGDPGAGERLGVAVALAHRHQAGHLVLGEGDLGAAEVGQAEVGDLEVHVCLLGDLCVRLRLRRILTVRVGIRPPTESSTHPRGAARPRRAARASLRRAPRTAARA